MCTCCGLVEDAEEEVEVELPMSNQARKPRWWAGTGEGVRPSVSA